ncbi:ribonuclease YeeF family protein [Halalkalibacterium halodurans]|uniref:ribonuclease YeeF family protein n=1 Tax=Halalkalibacterium halodurans TaxID=86665 RepID=UPI002AA985FE|nr:T7SS effector LXG polymorphic toxin [Halalkalibacterium halodurans]MDY7224622.1 T7SS effector LXG polymorphic toxin [Halalkalibacterium halodurans]MDY7240745.1 T7SS effector LXG polymorphic toxin [Halalkalibacterium halodurans]
MKFLDVNQHLSELDEHIKVLKSYGDVFEEVEARITRVINMDGAFKGEGAKGVIYNHAHMQLPTIRSIRAFLISFSETLEKMKAKINEYELASNGSVSEDFWKNQLPKAYDRYEETLEEREAAINQATAEVSHILHLGKLQTGDVYNSVDSARKHADTVLEGLYDLDQAGVELMAQVRTKMEELKATIRQVLDWTVTGGVTMKGVSIMEVGGYFANNATLHEKAPEVKVELLDLNPVHQYENNLPLSFKYMTMHSIMKRIKLANYQQWFSRMMRRLLPLTTHYNVMRMSAGKTVASQANASFGSTTNSYSILSTSLSDYDLEQYKQPDRELNAFDKSIQSFGEIWDSIYEASAVRQQKWLDSPYDFFNYWTLGVLDGAVHYYEGQQLRYNEVKNDFTFYNTINWFGSGAPEMVMGAVNPDDPYSAEHWMNSFGTATLVTGGAAGAASTGLKSGTAGSINTVNNVRVSSGVANVQQASIKRSPAVINRNGNQINNTFINKYSTAIDNKVTIIDKAELPGWIQTSYTDGVYRTVITNEPITVYRSFGGRTDAGGAFVTTQPSVNRIQTKIDSALKPEWGNTRMYEAVIVIPEGQVLNIGKIEKQYTKTGTLLDGGSDQILLPQDWPLEWITEIRTIPSK